MWCLIMSEAGVYTLAVNNTLTLLGSQANHFWALLTRSGNSAVGDVCSRPETMAKRGGPSENTERKQQEQWCRVSNTFAMSTLIRQTGFHQLRCPVIVYTNWAFKHTALNLITLFKSLPLPLTFERESSKCESNHIRRNTPVFGSQCGLFVCWYSFPPAILFFTVICDIIRKLKRVQY